MNIEGTEIINKRTFFINTNGDFIFLRDIMPNVKDISGSASLSMHKAIIGLCELNSIEKAEEKCGINLRASKAIQTYYIIYHLFCCCMLLDNDYEIIFKKDRCGRVNYGTELKELKHSPSAPNEWNNRKYKESDLAVRITHGDIKNYCKKKRRYQKNNPSRVMTCNSFLFNDFIKENCKVALFEKIDYIRDRSIYRPSHVASMTETPIQTSKNVRSQIDELPSSADLYKTVCDIQGEFCSRANSEGFGSLIWEYCYDFLSVQVDCSDEYRKKLGYSWEQLVELGGSKADASVPSFVAQAMELFSPDNMKYFYHQYWKKLLEITKKSIF